MKLIEHKGIIYGDMKENEFILAQRWASKFEPDMDTIEYAKIVSENEGTQVLEILGDWAESQADEDIANIEEEFEHYYQGE